MRNRFLDKYREAGPEPLAWPLQSLAAGDIYEAARARSDADYFPLLAGQGLRMLKSGQSAADIVGDLITEASATLMRLHR